MKTASLRLYLAVHLCLILVVSTASAVNYFVAVNGDDLNDGTLASPLATINHALELAMPGDTVYLRVGSYNQLVETVRDGTPSERIVVANYAGEAAYIDGTGITDGRNGFIIAHSYITVHGVRVRRWPDSGIWVQANVGFVVIRGCEVVDCGSGIDLYEGVHDFVVDSVDLHGFAEESHGFDATSHDGTPIYNGLVSNSRSHDGGGDNCDGFALGHASGYGSFEDVHDVRFVNCEVYNIGDGFDISGRNIVLENCVAHDTYYGGNYKLWATNPTLINCVGYSGGDNVQLDVGESPPVTATLVNCTFFNAANNNIWIQTDSCRLTMYNCIVAGGDNVGMRTEETFQRGVYTGDYNVFHCGNATRMFADPMIDLSLTDFQSGNWTQLSGQDSHSRVVLDGSTIVVDTTTATVNFHLRSGSPAIDAGTTILGTTPTLDREGNPRNDGTLDAGAYEYQGNSEVGTIEAGGDDWQFVGLTPNPISEWGLLRLTLPREAHVTIRLCAPTGTRVAEVFEGAAGAGELSVPIGVSQFATGAYQAIAIVGHSGRSIPFVVAR